MKTAYVCGPLTELGLEEAKVAKQFYGMIADVCRDVLGQRAFVPHEHYDPVKHTNFSPQQVDEAERDQVCNKTSMLIVVALAPSWGGGIEVEMACQHGVSVIILCEQDKLRQKKISRLLRGNPAVEKVIPYENVNQALALLRAALQLKVKEEILV